MKESGNAVETTSKAKSYTKGDEGLLGPQAEDANTALAARSCSIACTFVVHAHAQLHIRLQLWRTCGILHPAHQIQARIGPFKSTMRISECHIRDIGIQNILNFAGEDLTERHKLAKSRHEIGRTPC